jgi:hypothetical protein
MPVAECERPPFPGSSLSPQLVRGKFNGMSANEIMAELPKLNREDLERLEAQLRKLLDRPHAREKPPRKPIGQVMLEFAGRAEGLPEDYSANIDHYLYGAPKRQS